MNNIELNRVQIQRLTNAHNEDKEKLGKTQ